MQELSLQQLKNHLSKLGHKAPFISFRYIYQNIQHRGLRNRLPETNLSEIDQGLMVEVLVNGHFGYAATPDLSYDGIERATQKAIELAEKFNNHKVHNFDQNVRPKSQGRYFSPRKIEKRSAQEILDLLKLSEECLKVSPDIKTTQSHVQITHHRQILLSNIGTEIEQDTLLFANSFKAIAEKNGVTQFRTSHGGHAECYQTGFEILDPEKIKLQCKQIGEEALELTSCPDCPTDTRDLLLMPDQMLIQIHESIGHPLEIDRILGDERNYAGWSFVKPSDFGSLQYGSKLMNITFDPTIPNEFASYSFDDSGAPAKKEYLIKEGLLVRGLGGTESMARSQIPGVANFRAQSWFRAPIDRMANLNLEPGTDTVEELIQKTEKGVLMTSNRSWSIDDYRNKFQFGCEYAKLIENGKLTKTLKNPNYRGVSTPFWRGLKGVGNKSTIGVFGSPYCGKGEPNQIIRVGHASPACLFTNVEVFGGV